MDEEIRAYVRTTKQRLRSLQDVTTAFQDVRNHVCRDVDAISKRAASGQSTIPELSYDHIRDGKVSDTLRHDIRQSGAAIIRGVFPRQQAEDWNAELGAYIEDNDYVTKAKEKAGLDSYFSALDAGSPQIFGLYWSKPQVMARQAESMARTKQFLNRLWDVSGPMGQEFNPDQDYAYADRTRRRRPGDTTLGLSPHMDSGSYERWVDPAYQRIYGPVFEGSWQDYDPWKATFRTQTREFSSPSVCSMFRTFQGWTGLTSQGPGDGTLSLIPSARGIAYFLLRALQDDVPEDDLCGATPGRALSADPQWHADILGGLVSIPVVEPGDTVWWHPDLIHSVANAHTGTDFANVIYIGASPKCAKNEAYARRQAVHFMAGKSAPDFAAEDYEVDFKGRATIDDLTELGRRQMGL
ncbi:YbiU family protein [Pararhizobium sp. IMCC21322]|uniref:YbiU family protein n=1 Tax=Pararhizobium sp. IMCC21322 TaxID=3067903 RepID=UPI002741BD21|nr:YbiU family protein [Pararhizobium sp. IMCC21322]